MMDLLSQILYFLKWFFFEFTPLILFAPLGAIGEFLDAIGIVKVIISAIAALGAIIIAVYKRNN